MIGQRRSFAVDLPPTLTRGFMGTFDQARIRDEVTYRKEAPDIIDLVMDYKGKNRADSRNRTHPWIAFMERA